MYRTHTGNHAPPSSLRLRSAQLVRSNPARIKAAHLAYLTAGADVCTTASYQATVDGFMQDGTTTRAQAEALLGRAVDLAREARDEFWAAASSHPGSNKKKRVRPLVAASVGCYGASLADGSEYRGTYGLTPEELMAWHRPRLRLLARTGGADLLAFETVPCAAEVLALLRLVQEPDTCGGLPCWLTVACRDGAHLNSGESLAACAAHVAALDPGPAPRVVAFGVNCTPPQHVAQCLQVIRGALGGDDERLLLCYPTRARCGPKPRSGSPARGPARRPRPLRRWPRNGWRPGRAWWVGAAARHRQQFKPCGRV